MSDIQGYTALVALLSNVLLLIAQFVQIYKLKKELKDVRLVVNNTAELKKALTKPLEGIWEVRGSFSKYHNISVPHNSNGYAFFVWNDSNKNYDVCYSYSASKEQGTEDLVTAICNGTASCNDDGSIGKKLILQMRIINRSSTDKFNSEAKTFEYVSNKISENENRISRIEFIFKNSNTEGKVTFMR